MNLIIIFHINLLTSEAMFTGWNPTVAEVSLSIKSRLWCSKGTIDRKAQFTFYILVLTGYRLLLMRVEFRTAITRSDVSAVSDLNKILVKNRGSDIKTTAC